MRGHLPKGAVVVSQSLVYMYTVKHELFKAVKFCSFPNLNFSRQEFFVDF